MEGKVAGSGLSQNSADFRLNGQVHSLGIKGYTYKNINTNARFASERFDGLLEIDDPNLQVKINGTIDLREAKNIVNINASLDTAFLHNLNLSKDSIFLRADFVADTKGLTLDSLSGTADFHNFKIIFNNESLALDSIRLNAYRDKDYRSISLQTSLADAEIKGVFYLSDLYDNIRTLSKEIGLNLRNNEPEIKDYYQKKTYKPKPHQADINLTLKDVKPFVSLLGIDLHLSPNTTIKGKFTSGYTTIFQAYTGFDSLRYQGNLFLDSEVDFTASKIADSTSVLAMASIVSDRQLIGPKLRTKNLLVEGIWNNNLINFGLDADQDGQSNYIRLKGKVEFLHDSTVITMAPSSLQLLERNWSFMPDNYLSVKRGNNWNFHHLALTNVEQSLGVNGELSEDPSKILSVDIRNLDLSLLNVITTKKFTGIADAKVEMSDFYNAPSLQNDVNIKDLTVNEFLVGDVTGRNQWDTLQNKFNLNLYIDRIQQRTVNLVGVYDPLDKRSPLDIIANLENANIKILEPFLEDIFSDMGGTVSGQFNIAGALDAPRIQGEGTLSDAKIMINYLRTSYLVSGKIGLTPTSIYFKDIELTDSFKNKGKLNGAITHEVFSRMTMNIDASFRNFQVLNTSAKDNSLFYGQAYATGTVNLDGPISNLRITSEARTEKNTRVYIPVSGTSTSDQKEFINFTNFTDTTYVKKYTKSASEKINLTGITFDLNLDVTPDAYCEIIIDIKAGDIIRGRGNGDLKLQIDTKGEFNMLGPFEFTEGWYNFTLYDIINKEFKINKGSTITWLGDPYQGVLNIDASYNQLASLLPIILDVQIQESPPSQLRRKYPVQVLLELDGPMLSPLFTFDIDAKDLPKNIGSSNPKIRTVNLDLEFTAFKNKLDEQELKRQVFSLIVLRRFSPPESFNTSGTVVSSLSELLSNQLSYWMSQVDENLEIDVDIASMDQESFNTFQLRFSYTFMNGRLRVTGDGTFNNTSNQPTGSNPNSVAGDWTLDYKLTADGKLRVKMYSRTNVNPILYSVQNQTAMTTGASIIHTQSFNELRDLFTSSRKQNKKNEESKDPNKDAIKEEDGGE
jgi:hypothetical protein